MTLTALTALLAIGAPQNANLQPATTIADGPEPARIDVSHSTSSFAVRHFGVTKIQASSPDR